VAVDAATDYVAAEKDGEILGSQSHPAPRL
jgi:hypothetical protein